MAHYTQAANEEAREMGYHPCDEFRVPVSCSPKIKRFLWSHKANADQGWGRVHR
jgi:hypothetical protein